MGWIDDTNFAPRLSGRSIGLDNRLALYTSLSIALVEGCAMFVYFIKCINRDGYIKIGVAKEVQSRLDTMQTGCPYKLELLAAIKCVSRKQAYELEGKLHRLFKAKHIRGEWFRKVNMYKATDVLNKDVIKHNKTPHSEREWDDAASAIEANKHL